MRFFKPAKPGEHKSKGEAIIGTIVLTAFLTSAVSTAIGWGTTKLLNSPERASAAVNALKDEVNGIKSDNGVRDLRIANLEKAVGKQSDDIEYIRRSMELQNARQGIVIKTP